MLVMQLAGAGQAASLHVGQCAFLHLLHLLASRQAQPLHTCASLAVTGPLQMWAAWATLGLWTRSACSRRTSATLSTGCPDNPPRVPWCRPSRLASDS